MSLWEAFKDIFGEESKDGGYKEPALLFEYDSAHKRLQSCLSIIAVKNKIMTPMIDGLKEMRQVEELKLEAMPILIDGLHQLRSLFHVIRMDIDDTLYHINVYIKECEEYYGKASKKERR